MHRFTVTAVALAGFVSLAFAQGAPTMTGDSTKGKVLTDPKGMTLYIFDKDADGKSVCNGPCATNWPPLMATGDAKAPKVKKVAGVGSVDSITKSVFDALK